MEATPYTLYSKNSAARIAAMLQNPTLLFVLRDPVERLLSEFHMQQQRQLESIRNMTPEQVVNRYLRNDAKDPDSFNNLKLGRYIEYLRHFWEMFGHDHVYVMFFEEITSNPQREMQALCSHLGLDATFYGDYSFNVFNKSVNPQSLVMNRFFLRMEPVIARTRSRVMNHTYIYGLFENLVRMGKFALHRLNDRGASTKQTFSPETRAQLIEYYKPSVSALSLELGRRLPWRNFQSDNVTTKPDET